jgi:serine/threonine-protein kinase
MVAVKLLPAEVASDSVLSARFERELEVLKQLRHPNIVRCFGGTCESAERFYAMELVDGGTLADLLNQKGTLPWEFVVDYALQMCAALQYAHEHGVVHRDVKPGNFLMTKSGQIKLGDFGLASIATTQRLTAAGRTVGTIQYMAPEQIRGKAALTGQADLYALGCVLFEMLTGDTPYSGENAAHVMEQHLNAPIPHAAEHSLDCPLKLDQLIFELMSKQPEQRPASAEEVAWRLEEILQPGRRVSSVEPDMFSGLISKPRAAVPLRNVPRLPSDGRALQFPETVPSLIPWICAGVLLMMCAGFWWSASNVASQLHRAERQWVELLERSDPAVRILAANALAEFGPLKAATIDSLRNATRDANPQVRVAALASLAQHASECRDLQGEMLRIEKVDENADVRRQAGLALGAMKQPVSGFSFARLLLWGVVLAVGAAATAVVWNVWQRLKPVAAS